MRPLSMTVQPPSSYPSSNNNNNVYHYNGGPINNSNHTADERPRPMPSASWRRQAFHPETPSSASAMETIQQRRKRTSSVQRRRTQHRTKQLASVYGGGGDASSSPAAYSASYSTTASTRAWQKLRQERQEQRKQHQQQQQHAVSVITPFGLEAQQVDQEVADAMQALRQQQPSPTVSSQSSSSSDQSSDLDEAREEKKEEDTIMLQYKTTPHRPQWSPSSNYHYAPNHHYQQHDTLRSKPYSSSSSSSPQQQQQQHSSSLPSSPLTQPSAVVPASQSPPMSTKSLASPHSREVLRSKMRQRIAAQKQQQHHKQTQSMESKITQIFPAQLQQPSVQERSLDSSSSSNNNEQEGLTNDRVERRASKSSSTKPSVSQEDTRLKLNSLLASRLSDGPSRLVEKKETANKSATAPALSSIAAAAALQATKKSKTAKNDPTKTPNKQLEQPSSSSSLRPALKDDPKFERYFRMLKVGMPKEVVQHAMVRDGVDPSVLDKNPDAPVQGLPLKDDPKYEKYFKMLKMGLPMGAVQNAMERDGLDPAILEGDPNLPANSKAAAAVQERKKQPKDTHRRTRLHWETLRIKVRSNTMWAKIGQDEEMKQLEIDEAEFQKLFQAELTPNTKSSKNSAAAASSTTAAVRVIDSKRANNGGIILARLKLNHDELADVVDRIDDGGILTAAQMQNVIEYLPTPEERKALEAYMLSGGRDAAEKFDGLCECEKFMVAMMTVPHVKRKVRALLFKLQFKSFLESLQHDASLVDGACDELCGSVRLRKLLGIVLNVGNRLNTAGVSSKQEAGAFKLESLLKLNHAKAFDKKTTFLHYIVLVVQRNNQLLLQFQDDLPTVKKADKVYWDQCISDLEEVEGQLENVRKIALHQAQLAIKHRLKKNKKGKKAKNQCPDDRQNDPTDSLSDNSMSLEDEVRTLRSTDIGLFTLDSIKKVSALRDQMESTKAKFASLLEYFGEDENSKMQPHDLFSIFCTFCQDFEKAKEHVMADAKKRDRAAEKEGKADKRPAIHKSKSLPIERTRSLSQDRNAKVQRPKTIEQSWQARTAANKERYRMSASPSRLRPHDPQPCNNDESFSSSVSVVGSTISTEISMREKAKLRRQRSRQQRPSCGGSTSTDSTASFSGSSQEQAPLSPVSDNRSFDYPQQLSPRSSIRARRRQQLRRQMKGEQPCNEP